MDLSSLKTTALFFLQAAALSPERIVTFNRVKSKLAEVNFKKFYGIVSRMAAYLARRGIRRGDSVALFADNSFEFWVVDFACQISGIAVIVIHPLLSDKAVTQILKKSGARLCLAGKGFAERVYNMRSEAPMLREIISIDEAPRTRFVTLFSDALESVDMPSADRITRAAHAVKPDDISVVFWPVDSEPSPAAYTHEAVMRSLRTIVDNKILPGNDDSISLTWLPHVDYCARLAGIYLSIASETPFILATDNDEIFSYMANNRRVVLCGELPLFTSYHAHVMGVKGRFFNQKPFLSFIHGETARGGFLGRIFSNLDQSMSGSRYASASLVDRITTAITWGETDSYPLNSLSKEFGFQAIRLFSIPGGPPLGRFDGALHLFSRGDGDLCFPCNYSADVARGSRFRLLLSERISAAEKSGGLYEQPYIYFGNYILSVRYFEETLMSSRLIKRAIVLACADGAAVLVVPEDSLASVRLKPETVHIRIEKELEEISARFVWQLSIKRFAVLGPEFALLPREQIFMQCRSTIQKMTTQQSPTVS